MPSISKNLMAKWRNYHLTAEGRYVPLVEHDPDFARVLCNQSYPDGTIRETAAVHCADLAGASGIELFRSTAAVLRDWLKWLVTDEDLIVKRRQPVDCVPIGRGWSFSRLIGAQDAQIDLSGLAGMAMARPQDLHPGCAYPRDKVALVLGGTRLRELTNWAQAQRNLSVRTSGTHLGLTVAGAAATGSHGSRLRFGGIQDMVVGISLVTGPDRTVWIERASRPVLGDAAVAKFATRAAIRDDAVFDDVLIHLGGMGIVNGLALELVEDSGYALLPAERRIDADWLRRIAQGDYRALARALGRDDDPVFYELTIDPHRWADNPAVHTMYFDAAPNPPLEAVAAMKRSLADLIGPIHGAFEQALEPLWRKGLAGDGDPPALPDLPPVFDLYKRGYFAQGGIANPPANARWNQLHGDEITGGYPGALYNASFAIDRGAVADVIPLICAAVAGLKPTFLFTLRFVSHASGTLAFTRFPECAVIEIDGISVNAPLIGPLLGAEIEEGARRIRACLDGANALGQRFEYGMHWGKLGQLDAAKIERDYGPGNEPASPLARWRATRAALLDERMRQLFWNRGLVDYGLVARPPVVSPVT